MREKIKQSVSQSLASEEQIAERVALLLKAKQAYYNDDITLMSDTEFDRLEEQLRKWKPDHAYFTMVGIKSPDYEKRGEKINHKIAMLSMDKAKELDGVEAWLERLLANSPFKEFDCTLQGRETPLCVEPKIDGISASCYYENGILQYVATRGDGIQGQNISHIAPFITDIPKQIPSALNQLEVRGELYIPKTCTELQFDGRPLRNICAGLIHRKEPSKEPASKQPAEEEPRNAQLSHLRFVVYQCPQQRLERSEYRQIQLLAQLGFHILESKLCTINNLKDYVELYLNELRRTWPYETDGLIICIDDSKVFEAIDSLWLVGHHHHYAIALKPPAESGTTLLRKVHWQVGRHGKLSPVAEFWPLILASAVIERASLHNYANVQRLHLQVGDVLEVERAGDVIPYIRRNLGGIEDFPAPYLDCYQSNCPKNNNQSSPEDSSGKSSERDTQNDQDGYENHRRALSLAEARWLARQLYTEVKDIIPQQCPSCDGILTSKGVDLICGYSECPEQVIQRIVFWVKQANMEQIAEQSVRQLYKQGKLCKLPDLYRLNEDALRQIPGYAEKKIARFLHELNHSRRLSIAQLVERLGIPLVQQKSIEKIGELRRKSRWEKFIEQMAKQWHQRREALEQEVLVKKEILSQPSIIESFYDCQRTLLEEIVLETFSDIMPDWWNKLSSSADKPQIAVRFIVTLQKALFTTQEVEQSFLALLKLLHHQTGRNELWKQGFAMWQEFLLAEQPHYLELQSRNDLLDFHEFPSRYSVLESLSQWLADNQGLLQELLTVLEIQENIANAPSPLEPYPAHKNSARVLNANAQSVCMTGSGPLPRQQLEQQLKAAGYIVSATLNKSTQILLCADPTAGSSKLKKAREWGITVYSYDEFFSEGLNKEKPGN